MANYTEISKLANDKGVTIEFIQKFFKSNSVKHVTVEEVTLVDQENFDEALDAYFDGYPAQNKSTDDNHSDISVQAETKPHKSLIKKIIRRVEDKGHRVKERSLYTNLYGSSFSSKVYAQLHEVRDARKSEYNGICLAIPEAKNSNDIPPHPSLPEAPISILKGEHGPNKSWLRGSSVRGTSSPALVLFIPVELYESPEHEGWLEIDRLLEYSHDRRAKSSWSMKL